MGMYEGALPWDKANGRKVLIVEDNEINAEIIHIQMEDFGFKAEHADNGESALSKFSESPENYYSVIIMDIMMPVMDGHEATKRIRALERGDSNVPIIAITANAFDTDITATKEAGMDVCITKPYNKRELFQAVIDCVGE